MFTVKLFNGHAVKLVCGEVIDVYAVGPAQPDDPDKKPSTNVLEVSVSLQNDSKAFYVRDKTQPHPENFGKDIKFFDMAFIENASGATTHKVKPY